MHTFTFVVLALGILRLFTDIEHFSFKDMLADSPADTLVADSIETDSIVTAEVPPAPTKQSAISQPVPYAHKFNRILSVPNYDEAFPDANDIQLQSAQKLGVKPVRDREDAESRKSELVYVGANPYFHVDRLRSSIPYLVPKASALLQEIGRCYFDSLVMKGVPLHKIIATSILRSKADVEKLRVHNPNATENSCHLYGTTFDIAQNRFITIEDPDGPKRHAVTNDTLKWVLSEVLRDMRNTGRCYVKYERKQGCFHISVR